MIKLIRKNQKMVMVVLGVVLMLMFLGNLAPQTGPTGPVLHPVASVNGVKFNQRDLANYASEWQLLKTLYYYNPTQQNANPIPLLQALLGPELVSQIEMAQRGSDSMPMFFLLVQEANHEGIVVSEEDWQSLVTNDVYPQSQPGTDERDNVEHAVIDCLKIVKLINRAAGVVKISRPLQEYTLVNVGQDLTVATEVFRASAMLKDIAAPTDQQIQTQYNKFSDRTPAVPDQNPSQFGQAGDPLGFGYKLPNRVTLQYIGLDARNVKEAAIASKSQQDWYVAAYGEFKANRADYDSRPLPSTQPSLSGKAGEEPRKLDNLEQDFALHADLVLATLYQRDANNLMQDLLKEINEKLSAGYGTYRDALASSGGKLPTGPAAEFTSYNTLRELFDSLASQYHVTPILGNIQQFKTESQLADVEGIGTAAVDGTNGRVTFPLYAVRLFQPWMSDADKNSQLGALAIAQWQPSNVLVDLSQNRYVFRISGSDASHLPPLSDVRDQVIADYKISAAYDKALAQARSLMTRASQIGLDAAVAEAKLPPAVVTDPFNPEDISSGRAPAEISPLLLSADSARELAGVARQLLVTPAAKNGHPQLLAELYADRAVTPLELETAEPSWDAESKPWRLNQVSEGLGDDLRMPMILTLFKPEAVAARVNYQSLARQQ